ncbi:hypothetical protein CC117_32690 [Parafrankia colletiae]|uniref:ABC transporter domain-containing protein n=2 Tax=Parafrankia colletiae TaxID=573497 RepID=A0A1S1RCF7_9ACTN|nr:hypothetical protein CC117_32690 [Parafrankia colletiae]
MLSVHGLSATAQDASGDDVQILRDVSLELAKGERLGIIGQSGSGKTTLIRAILGLEDPAISIQSGTIEFGGETMFTTSCDRRKELRGRALGAIFQSATRSIYPFRRIESQLLEVVKFHMPMLSKTQARRRITEILVDMGLKDIDRILRSYPHQVSGGQLQRIAIALAMLPEPNVLLADECTSALDKGTEADVVRLLDRFTSDRRSLLFVTHDLRLAGRLCHKMIVLLRGEVQDAGESASILSGNCTEYTRSLLNAMPPWAEADGTWPPAATDYVLESSNV